MFLGIKLYQHSFFEKEIQKAHWLSILDTFQFYLEDMEGLKLDVGALVS